MTLAAHDVTVRMGGAVLLDDASIDLRPGEIVALAGPNGAGKTTLVRALAGDVRLGRGRVELDGRPLASWPVEALARRRAVMSTDGEVAFGFTARDVAMLGRLPIHGGAPGRADHELVRSLLEAVDCAELAGRTYATLSTGERQRVQLARALAQVTDADPGPTHARDDEEKPRSRFLLLDEPTSSLDPAHQHTAMRLLRHEAARGNGVLAVLHDLNLAAAYADRVALLKAARIVEVGPPATVLRSDLLETVFDVPMLVVPHPKRPHPLVIAEPPG